jgi:hypothetical protein
MSKEGFVRYPALVFETRLASVGCGSIGGRTIEQIADEAADIGIQMDPETIARIRRGEVENPNVSTSTSIIKIAHCIGVTPTNPFHIERVCEAKDLEDEHKLEKARNTPNKANRMGVPRFKLYRKAHDAAVSRRLWRPRTLEELRRTFRNQDDKFGWVWSSTNEILHAASASYDAEDEESLKQAIGMGIAHAYVYGDATYRRLAKDIRSWPGFTTSSPSVILQDKRGKTNHTSILRGKRWVQYSIAVQNAALAVMNIHALGVVTKNDYLISRGTASMQRLLNDFHLLPTFRFLETVCEGTDLQRKYLRQLAICWAVANYPSEFDKTVDKFYQKFKFDPVKNSTKVKGEAEYPALESDPSVERLRGN